MFKEVFMKIGQLLSALEVTKHRSTIPNSLMKIFVEMICEKIHSLTGLILKALQKVNHRQLWKLLADVKYHVRCFRT